MASVNSIGSTYSPNNHKSDSGVKVGVGMALFGAGTNFGMKKMLDFSAYGVSTASRAEILKQRLFIQSETERLKGVKGRGSRAVKAQISQNIANSKDMIDKMYKASEQSFNARKMYKNGGWKKSLAIAIPFYIGAGAIVDWATDKQRSKTEPNSETKKGNPYVKTNMGKCLGLGLGLISEIGMVVLNKLAKPNCKAKITANPFINAMLGGFVLGAITDHNSNKKARKAADKNA